MVEGMIMNQGYALYAVSDPVDLDEQVIAYAVTGWQQESGTIAWRPLLCPLGQVQSFPRSHVVQKGYPGSVYFWADSRDAQECRRILEVDRAQKRAERDRIRAESAEHGSSGAPVA